MQLLLLSNGHGEDLSGARLGKALQQQGASVRAVPLVGDGAPYRQAELPIAGRTQSFSTGGLGYASFAGRLKEILQSQAVQNATDIVALTRRTQGPWALDC